MLEHDESWGYLVWDPFTGGRHDLSEPDIKWLVYSAAVLCAVDGCDHLDCHRGPFRVVFAAIQDYMYMDFILASVYSSETSAWSVPVCIDNHRKSYASTCSEWDVQHPPTYPISSLCEAPLSEMQSTSYFGGAIQSSRFQPLFSKKRKVDTEEVAEWVQCKAIELEKTIPVANPDDRPLVVGFAEGLDVIFINSGVGLFTIKINSGQVKKVDDKSGDYFISILPYMSFYIPVTMKVICVSYIHIWSLPSSIFYARDNLIWGTGKHNIVNVMRFDMLRTMTMHWLNC
ncbi:hypothetical protein ACQ4PT_063286 [Festuca glaucescens]